MLATGCPVTFADHVFPKMLMVRTSIYDYTATGGFVTPEKIIALDSHYKSLYLLSFYLSPVLILQINHIIRNVLLLK
jgi:hypothetical protein